MSKSRKYSRMSKSMSKTKIMAKKTSSTAVRGIKKVGSVANNIGSKSTPIVEKGITTLYGTMATGFDLGVKGAKNAAKTVSRMTKKKRSTRKTHRTY